MALSATMLTFPGEDALRVALTSELVPTTVQAAPASYRRLEGGHIAVVPERSLTGKQLRLLKEAGAAAGKRPRSKRAAPMQRAACWAEIVLPRETPEHALETASVMFLVPRAGAALALAGELLRLGCDRQELCFLDGRRGPAALLRAIKPPYYTTAQALEHAGGLRAFAPTPPGQEQVWTELCHAHPMARQLQVDRGDLLLIGGDGQWLRYGNGPWIDLYQLLDIQLPGEAADDLEPRAPARRLAVPLKLSPGARAAFASLWVLRGPGAVTEVDRLVQHLPEREIDRLLYAVAGPAEDPTVILRARPGRGEPPALDLPAEAYAPWLDTGHLFLPDDAILEPPLRQETLRAQLAPDPDRITWLTPRGDEPGAFAVTRISDGSFTPLREWVEYIISQGAEQLESWIRAATFDFDAFESIGVEWSDRPPTLAGAPDPGQPRKQRRARREQPSALQAARPAVPRPPAPAAEELAADPAFEAAPRGREEADLADLERRFKELDAPADAPERRGMWKQMARLNARLRRPRDARLCWTRVLWEQEDAAGGDDAASWCAAELSPEAGEDAGALDMARAITRLLEVPSPEPRQVGAMAAALVASRRDAAADLADRLQQVQVWLNDHDAHLDCRALWLVRAALSDLVGGDTLQLTRTRDRILARLARGLPIERDVPTFLRFCGGGRGDADDDANVDQLAEQLERLLRTFVKARRKRSAVEAPEELTRAYVQLSFAYGFARLGRTERARELLGEAAGALDHADPIHDFLAQAYAVRVEHALAGLPPESALPTEVASQLNTLERFTRYKVDRLRQASQILEPQENLDPVVAFLHSRTDPRGEEFAPMRGMTDPAELIRAVNEVMDRALAPDTSVEDRDRLFDGVMDFFPRLPEAEAVPHLQTLTASVGGVSPPRRCMLLEEALMLAGYFMREDLVRELVVDLKGLIAELGAEHAAEVAKTLGQCLRSLRRVGLLEEAAELLAAAASTVGGEGSPAVIARLHLAAGMADVGRMEQARAIFLEGKKALEGGSLLLVDRLEITRALAGALSHAPQAEAVTEITKLADQLPTISDSFNTNSHFCLSIIQFMESLILGLASEQLVLGDLGRRWLDEDEYLVRRRIHRDLERRTRGASELT